MDMTISGPLWSGASSSAASGQRRVTKIVGFSDDVDMAYICDKGTLNLCMIQIAKMAGTSHSWRPPRKFVAPQR